MSTLSLVILGLLTAVPPASCQQGSIELGPQGCCGEEGWAGCWQPRCRWMGAGAVLASFTTLYTCSWREEQGFGGTTTTSRNLRARLLSVTSFP